MNLVFSFTKQAINFYFFCNKLFFNVSKLGSKVFTHKTLHFSK